MNARDTSSNGGYSPLRDLSLPALVRARIVPPAAHYVTGFTLVGLGLFTALAPSHRAK